MVRKPNPIRTRAQRLLIQVYEQQLATRRELAEMLNVPESTMSKWLRGTHVPTINHAETILSELGGLTARDPRPAPKPQAASSLAADLLRQFSDTELYTELKRRIEEARQ